MGLNARHALLGALALVAAALVVCTAEAAPHLPSVRDFTTGLKVSAAKQGVSKVAVASAQEEEYEGPGYSGGEAPYNGGSSSSGGYYGMAEEKEVCLTEVSRGWCDFYGDFYDWKVRFW